MIGSKSKRQQPRYRLLPTNTDSYRPMQLYKLQTRDSKLKKAIFAGWPFVLEVLCFVVAEVGVEPTCPVKDDRF